MDYSVRLRDVAEIELRDDVWIEAAGFSTMGGGPGATAAVVMARLGLRVAFVGRVGDDAAGAQIRSELDTHGVDTLGLEVDQSISSRVALVLVNQSAGTRSFVTHGETFVKSISSSQAAIIESGAALHLDWATEQSLQVARTCRARGARVTFDLARVRPHALAQAQVACYTTLSQRTASDLAPAPDDGSDSHHRCGIDVRHLASMMGRTTIVTQGERGCMLLKDGTVTPFSAPRIDDVIDTTGAGDTFQGALNAALSRREEDLAAIRYATTAASLSVRGAGGRGRLPTDEEIRAAMASRELFERPTPGW